MVKSCSNDFRRTALLAGFRQRPTLGQALASATTIGLRSHQSSDSSPQQVVDVLLANGHGKILSLEALSAVAKVERRKCSPLVLRCASALDTLSYERLLRFQEVTASRLPRDALVCALEAV